MSMYTTHGLTTGADYQDYLKDTDQGSTEIQLDNVPHWFEKIMPTICPICDGSVITHESVIVLDASGEIYACVNEAGERGTLPEPIEEHWG